MRTTGEECWTQASQLLEGTVVSFRSYPFNNPAGVSESA